MILLGVMLRKMPRQLLNTRPLFQRSLPLEINTPSLRSDPSFSHAPSSLSFMNLHSVPSEKSPITQAHVAFVDDVDVAAKLTANANSDIPLSPEATVRLK